MYVPVPCSDPVQTGNAATILRQSFTVLECTLFAAREREVSGGAPPESPAVGRARQGRRENAPPIDKTRSYHVIYAGTYHSHHQISDASITWCMCRSHAVIPCKRVMREISLRESFTVLLCTAFGRSIIPRDLTMRERKTTGKQAFPRKSCGLEWEI